MDIETIHRLTLARHLYDFGSASSRSANDIRLFSAVNLFQDAVESFLVAAADHVGARKQGQYLAFIYHYTKVNRRVPAEADIQHFFNVILPTVHQMILTLEKSGFTSRE